MAQSTLRSLDLRSGPEAAAERHDLLGLLAAQALTQVAGRVRAAHFDAGGRGLERLHDAAIGQDRRACIDVARALIADGLAAERICDVLIPGAVHRMGEEWVSGDLPFSTVTIGSARLQGLLRELDGGFVSRPERASGAAGAILLVVPTGADHTLGPLLLASQLRRRGFSVRLSLCESAEAVGEVTAGSRFGAVFLSSTLARFLPQLAQAAAAVRASSRHSPPIVLGGAVVGRGVILSPAGEVIGAAANGIDLAPIDYATSDLDEALRLCGLTAAVCG